MPQAAKGFNMSMSAWSSRIGSTSKPKQRVVCNLGRKDLLVANLDSLNRLLGAGEPADTERAAEQIAGADAWDWGPMLVTATLWRELGLEQDRLGGRGKRDGVALSERALVLVANRLCAPSSEHGLATLARDRLRLRTGRGGGGCRSGAMMGNGERVAPRGFAWSFARLKQWYRTLDQLHGPQRTDREGAVFALAGSDFSLEVDMVFYDLTSTYFEGQGPPGLGAHGIQSRPQTA